MSDKKASWFSTAAQIQFTDLIAGIFFKLFQHPAYSVK
jgi:hypothetical protein